MFWAAHNSLPAGSKWHANFFGQWELEEGRPAEQVKRVLVALMARHEGLRTYYAYEGSPIQIVVPVADAAERCIVTAEEDAWERQDSLRQDTVFDIYEAPPVKFVIRTASDSLCLRVAVLIHHASIDHHGFSRLTEEFFETLAHPALADVRDEPVQPIDLALHERSASGLRQAERAAGYWREKLNAIPNRQFPWVSDGLTRRKGFVEVHHNSSIIAKKLDIIADRLRVTEPLIMATAFAMILSELSSNAQVGMFSMSANRRPKNVSCVTCVAQPALLHFDLSGVRTLADGIRRNSADYLRGMMYGEYDYDTVKRESVLAASRRGIFFRTAMTFNYVQLGHNLDTEPDSAIEVKVLTPDTIPSNTDIDFMAIRHPDSVSCTLDISEAVIDEATSSDVLKGMYRLINDCADSYVDPETRTGDPGSLITGPVHSSSWRKVDNCWVNVSVVADELRKISGVVSVRLTQKMVDNRPHLAGVIEYDSSRANENDVRLACRNIVYSAAPVIVPAELELIGLGDRGKPAPPSPGGPPGRGKKLITEACGRIVPRLVLDWDESALGQGIPASSIGLILEHLRKQGVHDLVETDFTSLRTLGELVKRIDNATENGPAPHQDPSRGA
ncbi:condensation domain-containing protein [Nonomuraea insulae]|uniref:Condensation domain-containing protein n=1 Tax=Nonomuraea insulae TaxID=1616787 RepID=A0ABW1D6C5_9ACTN